jgi:hypothetical protein
MAQLTASVGRGGRNHRNDVITVQRLINAKLPIPLAPLREDGVCGAKTIFAIGEYQRRNLNMNPPDARVDPGGATFRSLTGGGNGAPGPPVSPPGGTNRPAQAGTARQAMDYFVGQGWTAAQAAGIAANLQAESGFRPDIEGDGGHAYGIAQWHADRQAGFQSLIGHAIQGSTFDEQLRFVQHELTNGGETRAGNLLRNATSANDAGGIVSRNYERPADREGAATRRGRIAEQILNNYPH